MAWKISNYRYIGEPGESLEEAIGIIVSICKISDIRICLIFNGNENWLSKLSDIDYMLKNWYNLNISEYDIIRMDRDSKINSIIENEY
jgi:hypothetical protein